jgi:formylglycine-generating enzyme required for sulfatase activity
MSFVRLALVLPFLFLQACGSGDSGNSVLSGSGESCTKTADCPLGLKCVNLICQQVGADCPADRDCSGLECGPDPICGESCGTCGGGKSCQVGQCVLGSPDCPADKDCSSLECGSDPVCGESCGGCNNCGETCQLGVCIFAAANCEGKECGPDGCGGSCGTCGCGEECYNYKNQCVFTACDGRECGGDGCGGSCGTCSVGEICESCECVDSAVPETIKWVLIPGGTYQMGCSSGDEDCDAGEKPSHLVTVSEFEILETEVTEAQYESVIGTNPSCNCNGCEGARPNSPVECVTWLEAMAFCEAVGGRLPTEAEWEYAARGGTTTRFPCGDDYDCLKDMAWYLSSKSGDHKHVVKGKAPNAYGLYDVIGNVSEWVADCWHVNYGAAPSVGYPAWDYDCQGSEQPSWLVRGGSFHAGVSYQLRVSTRGGIPGDYFCGTGLRCARFVEGQ